MSFQLISMDESGLLNIWVRNKVFSWQMQKLNCCRSNVLGTSRMIIDGISRPFSLIPVHCFAESQYHQKTGRSKLLHDTKALVQIIFLRYQKKA